MKKWVKTLALVVGGCGFALILVEIGLRVFGISYPHFYVPDNVTGYAPKPGAEGLLHREGNAYITINKAGLRDREHSLEKLPGTFRIAVLGNSYTEAKQLPLELTYWARLEQELLQCPVLFGQMVEVVNFGVSEYNTGQELLVLRHKVPLYHPDLVLLAFYTGNDIRGICESWTGTISAPTSPFERDAKCSMIPFGARPNFSSNNFHSVPKPLNFPACCSFSAKPNTG